MATFFGEVLSVFSRAVEEDEEEEEDEEDEEIRREMEQKREVHIHWCPEAGQPAESSHSHILPCSHFILAVGPNAAGFLSAYVLSSASWDAVGRASLWNERNRGSSRQPGGPLPGEPACVFYRHRDNPEVLICQNTCYIAEDQQFQWTEKVFGHLQQRALSVLVLADSPMAEYRSPDYLSSSAAPFLRCLQTATAHSQPLCCPPLEQPNMATGLPAAVLSHCQVQRVPAVLYLCYSDVISPAPDSVTMETYKPALSSLSKLFKLNPCPSTDLLHKLATAGQTQSNLYT